ncbi:NAD(P)H-hydrate dehydratase [Candidatus Aenigmatarchaeota archaeon]
MQIVSKNILKKVYPKRRKDAHKGDFGKLLVIAGSHMFIGAPVLASLAAYRSGTDIVTLASPQRTADIAAKISDIITYPLYGDFLSVSHVNKIKELSEGKNALLIGPGLGEEKQTMKAIRKIVSKIDKPMIIDADGIKAMKKYRSLKKSILFTPHSHEFEILSNTNIGNKLNEKIKSVNSLANSTETVILLKGNPDIISNGIGTCINKTGNAYMTVGGTGDVLSGICASLVSQGNDLFSSACAASYINGRAGDIVARKKKQAMIASDLLEAIISVIKT